MAKRRNGNGHDVTQADILRVLERIERNTDETRAEVKQLNGRLDAILENLGAHHRDHERRIAAIEAALKLNQ
jgi:hypothetical protein